MKQVSTCLSQERYYRRDDYIWNPFTNTTKYCHSIATAQLISGKAWLLAYWYKNFHRVSIILLGTNFSEILIEIQNFSFTKNAAQNVVCEMGAILSRWRWANITCLSPPGLRVNIKTVLPGYRNSNIKDKTVVKQSYLYNGNLYDDKTAFIHWDGSRGPNLLKRVNFPAWISNYIHYKVLDVITYTFPNFIKLKFLNG